MAADRPQPPVRYSRVQIALHWGIAALFAFNYIVSDGMGRALRNFSQTGINDSLTAKLHIIGGIFLLGLMVLRLVFRALHGAPPHASSGYPLMDKAAIWGHRALYALLLLLPMAGLAAWFGGLKVAGEAHEVLVNLTALLIAGHIAAALYHQFILKDRLLDRMRPK